MELDLSHVRVVMVNTSHPGNIGAVARAMKNMGLSQLHLVQPHEFPSGEARARSSGATDILDAASVHDSLEQALVGCSLVVGASARLRTISWPTLDPRQMAEKVIEHTLEHADSPGVALVLGREQSGLTNEELGYCHFLVHIPANPEYSSLNVAAAAQVLTYELRMAALAQHAIQQKPKDRDHPLATSEELEGLYAHFETALTELGFLDPDEPKQLMHRLRRLFNRSHLDRIEINILRGMLKTAQQAGKPGSRVRERLRSNLEKLKE